jgi:hypothetical protein
MFDMVLLWSKFEFVIPAQAGIHPTLYWIRACAGMTDNGHAISRRQFLRV